MVLSVKDIINSISDGLEKEYYEDGTLKQKA
jgi:antitoxin component YwqK of YwqJK toxin-antitoxin module